MTSKFTIAFYCSSSSWGGLEMNTLRHAVWMKERGHSVHLFCVKNSPLDKAASNSSVNLVHILRNKKGIDFKNARRIKKALKPLDITHLWFRDKRDLSVLALTKILCRKRWKLIFQQAMQLGVSKREFWHTIRFNQIDYWIAPLNYLADQVKEKTRFPAHKIHVIPLAVEIDTFLRKIPDRTKARHYFGLSQEDFVVGMIGRIDPHKAQGFVMDAVENLKQSNSNLKMLMVGSKTEGEWKDYFDDVQNRVNNSDFFVLHPFMNEVGYFYSAVDVFVMASKNETFGMVTIEAMLAAKQIAGTNSAGTKELIGQEERGYFFNWQDQPSLVKTLNRIIQNQSVAKERAERAKKYAKNKFSHLKECEQIEELLNR